MTCRSPRSVLSLTAVLVFLSGLSFRSAGQVPADTARQVFGILEKNCSNSGCHGGAGAYSFDVRNPRTLLDAKVIDPGHAADSELIRRLEAGVMPLGGAKLPDAEIALIKRWVDAGAPLPVQSSRPSRPFAPESETVAAIVQDLEAASAKDRGYLRYASLANLWNAADVDDNELAFSRSAFNKLMNHLSWKPTVVPPRALGANGALFRIDLRDYGWTGETWNRIVSAYPYAMIAHDLQPAAARIRTLSGAALPYIRADWFIAKASMPPLYHEILDLPDTLQELERRLNVVGTNSSVPSSRVQRFGLRNSGVSRNNRAMERQTTRNGAYWKSFDFSGNRIEQNIFRDPVHLVADGGEIIFSLPNGLQGYFIVNAEGQRIDDAPIAIVRDRTNPDDPVVHNGRSCIGCHIKGMNGFQDEIAAALSTRASALFDMKSATAMYRGQAELDLVLEQDNRRFREALQRASLDVPAAASEEPVSRVARRYEQGLSPLQAAAELNVADVALLKTSIANSVELQRRGFDQLTGLNGGIPRDTWEQGFDRLVQEMRLGEPIGSDFLVRIGAGTTMRFELADPLDLRTARKGAEVWFRTLGTAPIPKGSSVRGSIVEIQQGKGPTGIRFVVDAVRLSDGTLVRLPASVVTLVDAGNSAAGAATQPLTASVTQLLSALNNAGAARAPGWNGALAPALAPNTAPAANSILRGAVFEARF